MGANKVHGSQQRMFEDVGQELGLEWQAQEGSSVEDVRKIIRTHFVVVNFYDAELGNGHFAVMQEVRTKFVVFGDPWFGPDRKMLIADFEDCWRPGTYGKTRWFFAVANN